MKIKKQFDPFKNLVLDDYEREIEESLARGEYIEAENLDEIKKMFQDAAQRYPDFKQKKRITLRVDKGDLIRVKAKAKRKNIPYQRIIGTLIRQYANDQIPLAI